MARKSESKFVLPKNRFSTHFNPKHLKNHDKPIHGLQKIIPKTEINPKPKINHSSYMFFMNFKGKKTTNMNSLNKKKLFDTNTVRFDSLNRCQRHVSLYLQDLTTSLSTLSTMN